MEPLKPLVLFLALIAVNVLMISIFGEQKSWGDYIRGMVMGILSVLFLQMLQR